MNLLNRAKQLLQGTSASFPSKTQYYRVACPEGHRLSGSRTEGYQALRCPTCGAGVFILPRSPLPEPPAGGPQRSPGAAVSVARTEYNDAPVSLTDPPTVPATWELNPDVEIEWMDEERPAPVQPAGRPGTPEAPPSAPARSNPQRRRAATPARDDDRTVAVERKRERFDWADWAKRRRNPLIFGGVALLVLATVLWRIRQIDIEDAPRKVEIGRTLGLAALDEGRFDTAHKLLSEAARAVDSLGGRVEGADEVRQGAREAALYTNLLSEALETLISEADPSETSSWPGRFAKLYKGRAIIIDATVVGVPGQGGATRYELDYRVLSDGSDKKPRVGRIDTKGFRHLEDIQPKIGNRVVFGARLASFALGDADEWLIRLEPDSGVEMMHPKALAVLGWPSGEEPSGENAP